MNKNSLVIQIKKRSQQETMIWVILVLPFLFSFFIDIVHLPQFIKYICDVCWVILFLLMGFSDLFSTHEVRVLKGITLSFFIYTLLAYMFNFQSPFYYLWGVRNNFRGYVVFFAAIAFMRRDNIPDVLSFLDKMFWINLAVCLYQHFVLGLEGDLLGGLFGTEEGSNAYLNIFFVIVITKSFVYFLHKKESLVSVLIKCALIVLVCAFAELKFFFVEFIVVLICSIIFGKFSFRKATAIFLGFFGVMFGIELMISIFPNVESIFTVDGMLRYAGTAGYTSRGDVNRLTAITVVLDNWLKTPLQYIFGLGLGNCDVAFGYDFLTTPFFIKYGKMHYNWFSTSFMFLECGFIGLIFLFAFFIVALWYSRKIESKLEDEYKIYNHISSVIAVMSVIFLIYNSAMRSEAGYMAYIVLAFPFILQKSIKKKGLNNE